VKVLLRPDSENAFAHVAAVGLELLHFQRFFQFQVDPRLAVVQGVKHVVRLLVTGGSNNQGSLVAYFKRLVSIKHFVERVAGVTAHIQP